MGINKDIRDLCCDISDMENPMCWGCYIIWYERESREWKEEEYFLQGNIEDIFPR